MLQVVKRDGRVKDYDPNRIFSAIIKAYDEVVKDQTIDMIRQKNSTVSLLVKLINNKIVNYYDVCITVDNIQNIVVDVLRTVNEEVSDAYLKYMNSRRDTRDSNNELMRSINGIINSTNTDVMSENSNKQATLCSTQRDLIAGEVSKAIARTMIPEHLMDAHNRGLMKIHDLDYYMQGIYNCELVNLDDMLQNGTVINKKKINKPRSLRTAMTITTQIIAQVASSTYGGQTITLSHLAPFVRISEKKIRERMQEHFDLIGMSISPDELACIVNNELVDEIRDAVQTFNYQISTIMTTNGQAPFISVAMYIAENPEYERETIMLIKEFLNQRIEGMENEYGVKATQTFPKLLYFLDDNNIYEDCEYYWLTELAVKSTLKRMNPDYISVKKMKEIVGHAFPPMGCRAFLSPFRDNNDEWIFYGRGNLGVQSINLPYVALEAKRADVDVRVKLDEAFELARQMCELRYEKLRGVKANTAPILWQHGAIARLNPDDDILKAVDGRGFTVTIGYSGLYEMVKVLTGQSHTSEQGLITAQAIMKYMKDKCELFKKKQPHLRFALYGTPQESTTGWFNDKLVKEFGVIKNITDKGWITNSYHVDIREEIDAFTKLEIESKLQQYSTGGAVSYIETCNMSKNPEAGMAVVKDIYEKIMYAEINFEADVCGKCKYEGVMSNDPTTLKWFCPNCGNDDQTTLSVVRRTCGYLGETDWSDGRKLDILNRVKHI